MHVKLRDRESVVTAFAEPASGPGWANSPLWVIVRAADGSLRQECLQPGEQTAEMRSLYPICAAAHRAMTSTVSTAIYLAARKVKSPRRVKGGVHAVT